MKRNYTKVRKHDNKPIKELDEAGNVIAYFKDPYHLREVLEAEGKKWAGPSVIVERIRRNRKIYGRIFKFDVAGDYETTSNNLPEPYLKKDYGRK